MTSYWTGFQCQSALTANVLRLTGAVVGPAMADRCGGVGVAATLKGLSGWSSARVICERCIWPALRSMRQMYRERKLPPKRSGTFLTPAGATAHLRSCAVKGPTRMLLIV